MRTVQYNAIHQNGVDGISGWRRSRGAGRRGGGPRAYLRMIRMKKSTQNLLRLRRKNRPILHLATISAQFYMLTCGRPPLCKQPASRRRSPSGNHTRLCLQATSGAYHLRVRCTVQGTNLCRSESPTNDALRRCTAPNTSFFSAASAILRNCDAFVTNFTVAVFQKKPERQRGVWGGADASTQQKVHGRIHPALSATWRSPERGNPVENKIVIEADASLAPPCGKVESGSKSRTGPASKSERGPEINSILTRAEPRPKASALDN
ncbi:hypothetical protein EVAR_21640_1 [Eumeta japonica]|uniref:Uncharacterized protein n=1 Tax=Eumeta variegata TaxID=151549 RepID=A0A4C1VHM8_EUMVA|nr:hypothetical protein EVAR_21640_1 [Eumeta japonica]